MTAEHLHDMTLKCSDCNEEFLLTEDEARWFLNKGWSLPKRCLACRRRRRAQRPTGPPPSPRQLGQALDQALLGGRG